MIAEAPVPNPFTNPQPAVVNRANYRGSTVIIGGSEEDAFISGAAYLYSSRLFVDDFESGDTTVCSTTSP
jgi:hypothetical protein